MTDSDAKLAVALEALELAAGIIDYCGGDAWERECTADARDKFQSLLDQLFPGESEDRRYVEPTLPVWPSKQQMRAMYGYVRCGHCNRKISGDPHAIKQHTDAMHAGLAALTKDQNP